MQLIAQMIFSKTFPLVVAKTTEGPKKQKKSRMISNDEKFLAWGDFISNF